MQKTNDKKLMEKAKLEWHTERRRVDDLIPFEKNPRTLSPAQEDALRASLEKFNLAEIPAVNTDGKIVAGHQRIKILKLLGRGREKIEVRVPSRKLTDREYDEYLLRSNANSGSWDHELLKGFEIGLLTDIGFSDEDLSLIWDENLEIESDGFDEKEELEKARETGIRPGDLFRLGDHRLVCGNSHEKETLDRLMGKERADAVYNDPIYNIGLDYDRGIGGKARYGGNVKDKKSDAEYREFLRQGLENSLAHAKDDCHVFSWCDQKYIWLLQTLFADLKIKNRRVCFWVKNGFNPTPKVAFNKATESCIYGTRGRPYLSKFSANACELLNKEVSPGNRAMDDIMDIFDIWLARRDAGSEYGHSTQKPLTLHEKPLRRCTRPGDIVLDIYSGSGSTLLSCEQLKRKCYASEINPIFCQLIINRYENYAKKKAKKLN